jgi:hypothetical protein
MGLAVLMLTAGALLRLWHLVLLAPLLLLMP